MSLLEAVRLSAVFLLGAGLTLLPQIKKAPSAALEVSERLVLAQSAPAMKDQSAEQPRPRSGHAKSRWDSLGLTETQKARIQKIKAARRQQMQAVLTDEQREQWRIAKSQSPRQYSTLKLSLEQQSRLKAIRESSRRQIDAVLTPEQRQKQQDLRQQWRQRKPPQNQSSGGINALA